MSVSNLSQIPSVNLNFLESLKGRNDPEALKVVAKELESLFAYELIKAMRKTIGESSKKGLGGEVYTSIFDMELARLCAEKGLGIKEMLLRSLDKEKYIQPSKIESSEEQQNMQVPSEVDSKKKSNLETINDAKSVLPADGKITSKFGLRRHPIQGDMRFHYGVDISAPKGTEIYPIKDGVVIFSGEKPGYGNIIIIDHGDGLVSKYAHNEVNIAKEGEEVKTNNVIAKVGNTGSSTGPHLHFELLYNGININPLEFLDLS